MSGENIGLTEHEDDNKFSSTFIDNITKLAQYQSQSQISTFTDHSFELMSEENIGLTEHQSELYYNLLNILMNLKDYNYDESNINELKEFLKLIKMILI
ncbi:hypothetical protein [Wolbachia endosymbiont of Chironomus riparius]|uniref:hypothetical protein n=1 Tax=Wolbachia endosymbiont of Chironomus riparius TaxID=2883238 RepID=UPI00209E0B0B|nr:hypothetical protein [Wolbachia endosymbiont of Chironomus riparius]